MLKKVVLMLDQKDTTPFGGKGFLASILFLLFIIPIFPIQYHKIIYNLTFSTIFILALLSLESGQVKFIFFVLLAIITEWIAYFFDIDSLAYLSKAVNFIFFGMVVIKLITQVARSKEVTVDVIIESINGYLLLGLTYAIVVAVVHSQNPEAISFLMDDVNGVHSFGEYFYFTFVTYTTLGYGEIVPVVPFAKGLVVLIAISGQMYLTILIAILIGKYLSAK